MIFYVIVTTILLLLYIKYRLTIRHLVVVDTMFPGPTCLPIIGNALMLRGTSEDFYKRFTETCFYYRRSFRVWIAHRLFIACLYPEDAEVILGNNFEITKADVYEFLLPWIGDGLITSTGKKWRTHRKMLTPAFHFRILEEFTKVFNKNGKIFCEVLSKIPENKIFDVYEYVKMYAMDNICETAMSVSINAQKNPNSAYIRAVKDMCTVAFKRMRTLWLRSDFLFRMSPWAKVHDDALSLIHSQTRDVIKKRKQELERNPDLRLTMENDNFSIKGKLAFLDILLHAAQEYRLTDEDIREEVDTFMFEGHDTITSAISFAMYYISRDQEVQKKILQETESIFRGEDREPTVKDFGAMKYLETVIKETLRLHPSVPFIARKISQDFQIDMKAYAPRGAEVLVVIAALHRNPYQWEKWDQFYPEHFLPEATQKRHPYSFVPFSAGPRNCIGQKFAMIEMKSVLSKVVKEFELIPSPHPEHAIREVPDLILTSGTGMHVGLRKRISGAA
uniref:CYP4CC1 n=1 Tax=Liposcelis bostrychophila TaxID=185214 RepID=B6DEP0_LIPBO|nr:CYP4CC1 [Liposcelis bostrychophila]